MVIFVFGCALIVQDLCDSVKYDQVDIFLLLLRQFGQFGAVLFLQYVFYFFDILTIIVVETVKT